MSNCLTRQIALSNISGCLVEKPECEHAYKFGFSIVCRHPEHTKFHAHTAGELKKESALELYDELRRKRRSEFMANLDETSRRIFCHQTDFFGQPLTGMDLNEQH